MPKADSQATIAASKLLPPMHKRREPVVAILIHDMFEDWLESSKVPLDVFCTKATGSWWFNYAQAFRRVEVGTVLICTSSKISAPSRFMHQPTGAIFWVLPAPRNCRLLRRLMFKTAGAATTCKGKAMAWIVRAQRAMIRHLASYVSTPLTSLATVLRQEGVACVLVEEYEYPRFDLSVLLGWKLRLPVFGTFCGARPQGLWRRPLRPLALRLCAGFAICARCEADRVRKQYAVPPEKVAIIYYPLDFSIWHPGDKAESRELLGIPLGAQVVMYHGAILLETKGLGVLLEAWERLCGDRPASDLRLFVIGTGLDEAKFSRILATKRLRGVHWLNQWLNDQGLIQQHLSAADVYVFPSRSDACPVSVAEAMACGVPVVASKIRGIPDLLPQGEESGGILIPSGDPNALMREISRLLDEPVLARELGHRARHHAETNFSMETVGKRLGGFLLADR